MNLLFRKQSAENRSAVIFCQSKSGQRANADSYIIAEESSKRPKEKNSAQAADASRKNGKHYLDNLDQHTVTNRRSSGFPMLLFSFVLIDFLDLSGKNSI